MNASFVSKRIVFIYYSALSQVQHLHLMERSQRSHPVSTALFVRVKSAPLPASAVLFLDSRHNTTPYDGFHFGHNFISSVH